MLNQIELKIWDLKIPAWVEGFPSFLSLDLDLVCLSFLTRMNLTLRKPISHQGNESPKWNSSFLSTSLISDSFSFGH